MQIAAAVNANVFWEGDRGADGGVVLGEGVPLATGGRVWVGGTAPSP